MDAVLAEGGDVLVRVAWRNGRWLTANGERFDMIAAFKASQTGQIDQSA